ncbi:MAG: class I lanthipeptide [Acidobacteriota bacterium]|nr:class I lanthipeptide [Acidobacteriota bacterium]
MKKKTGKKIELNRETLRQLTEQEATAVVGASLAPCKSTGPCPIT